MGREGQVVEAVVRLFEVEETGKVNYQPVGQSG
jgi:hypothetical protein